MVPARAQNFEMTPMQLLSPPLLIPPPHGDQNNSLDQHDQQNRPHNNLRSLGVNEFLESNISGRTGDVSPNVA